jgi:nitroreductase
MRRLADVYPGRVPLDDLVGRRRMVRAFTTEPVPAETIERLVGTARRAPTAGNTQGISFVAVTEETLRREVAAVAGETWYTSVGHAPFISQAPVQIVVCAGEALYRARYAEPDKRKPDGPPAWPVPWWYVDAGGALVLLLLAAVDAGLEAAFVGVRSPPDLAALLGVPAGHHPIGVVLIGHGAPDRRSRSLDRPRRSTSEVLHWQRWERR